MLSAIDRKRDPGHISCLRKIHHGGRNILGSWPTLKRQALSLGGELYIGLTRTWQGRSRCNRIYPNPGRQRLSQRDGGCMQSSFAQGVREKARRWPQHPLVKNIDNRGIKAGGAPGRQMPEKEIAAPQDSRRLPAGNG